MFYQAHLIEPGITIRLLWDNANREASFAAQTISIGDYNVNDFDYIVILAVIRSNSSANAAKYIKPLIMDMANKLFGGGNMATGRLELTDAYNYVRTVSSCSENQITFENCVRYTTYGSSTTSTQNSYIIPACVLGVTC